MRVLELSSLDSLCRLFSYSLSGLLAASSYRVAASSQRITSSLAASSSGVNNFLSSFLNGSLSLSSLVAASSESYTCYQCDCHKYLLHCFLS